MTNFKELIEKATDEIYNNNVATEDYHSFHKGAKLPNELLLKALEALERISLDVFVASYQEEYQLSKKQAKEVLAEIKQVLEEVSK